MRFGEICAAFINIVMATLNLKKLDKDALELLGRKFGIELDKRKLKGTLVKTLTNYIDGLTKDDLEAHGRVIGIELDKRLDINTLIDQLAAFEPTEEVPEVIEPVVEEQPVEVKEEQSEGETEEEEALRRGIRVNIVRKERHLKNLGRL
jgi:hypothetical protein